MCERAGGVVAIPRAPSGVSEHKIRNGIKCMVITSLMNLNKFALK